VAVIWLAFILAPPIDAVSQGGHGLAYALPIAGAAAFSVCYIVLAFIWFDEHGRWRAHALSGALASLAIVMTIADRSSWGYLFSYVAACGALTVPSGWSVPSVLAAAAVAAGTAVLGGGTWGAAAGYAISTVGVGLLLTLLRDLRTRNLELTEARAELARTAVTAERERFARDLHDLLGHSLSLMTLKGELAGRLIGPEGKGAEEVVRWSGWRAKLSGRCGRPSPATGSQPSPPSWRAREPLSP